jgi:sporadic carbohydrate cluster protein (TIGR04323 family)
MTRVRGYIFSRPFMGERVPQHVQNLVIRDYCDRRGFQFLLSATEYAMERCHLMLRQVLDELPVIDGIVLYSLFQLPESVEHRQHIYRTVIDQEKSLHFSVEGLRASTRQECEHVEILWRVRLTLPFCGYASK